MLSYIRLSSFKGYLEVDGKQKSASCCAGVEDDQ